MPYPSIGKQEPPKLWVIGELNPEQIPDFALAELRPRIYRNQRWARLSIVYSHLQEDAGEVLQRKQVVDDLESFRQIALMLPLAVIHARYIGNVLVFQFLAVSKQSCYIPE